MRRQAASSSSRMRVRLGEHLGGAEPEAARDAADRPGEVHRRRPRPGEQVRRLPEPRDVGAATRLDGEAVRGCDADGGRAADGEVLDRARDLVRGGELEPALLVREEPLVEEPDDVPRLVVEHRPERLPRHSVSLPSPAKSRSAK